MSLDPKDYANLADHSYDRDGRMTQLARTHEVFELGGEHYKVLEHRDNPDNGYQGTIYQHLESGEIVVGHRGTEFERETWNDLLKTDRLMVTSRENIQADDAIALTGRARELAASPEMVEAYGHAPEVTVTGHSLGGTLAQISAHYYDLRGETFNAYGAASLDRRIPEGGDRVVNHVIASDLVSSASPHYGQVRIYTRQADIDLLDDMGYENNDSRWFDLRHPAAAGTRVLDSHDMHLFTDRDGQGRPDQSVLDDPRSKGLTEQYTPMIEKYREDVGDIRSAITFRSSSLWELGEQGIDYIRGPLKPGEPAARDGKSEAVSQMLESAGRGDVQGIERAQGALWMSPYGQDWQQRVEEVTQQLNAQEHATQTTDLLQAQRAHAEMSMGAR